LALDAECIQNDSEFNQIYRSLILLPVRRYPADNFTDRSGIFLSGSPITIPSDTYTAKTYAEIMDETAGSYANLNPVVMWSGGIDSTAILAALVKNNIKFSVAFDANSQREFPEMYDHVRQNFDCLPLNNYLINDAMPSHFDFLKQPVSNRTVITGDCNDQLFPVLQHNFSLGKRFFKCHQGSVGDSRIDDFYKSPVNDSDKYLSAEDYFVSNHSRIHQCDTAVSQALYNSAVAPKLSQFPMTVEYAYQLAGYFRFIFKYQMHLDNLVRMNKNTLGNNFQAFYNTEDFQRWAMTNFETLYQTECATYTTMKTTVKQYSYSVFNIPEILSQHKRGSELDRSLTLPDNLPTADTPQ